MTSVWHCLTLCALLGLSRAIDWDWDTPNELDAYMAVPESVYGYEVLSVETVPGATMHILNMTSLTWLDETVTTRPIWWHYQVIIIPDNIVHTDSALMYISSGNNTDDVPTATDENVADAINLAVNTGSVACLLEMIPNQPLYFVSEGGSNPRREDAIVAYSWQLYIEGTVDIHEVNALWPMTKATKLGVDTLIEYAASVDPSIAITQYMPTGFNKRGWAGGLAGCMDQRAFAAAPLSIDLLNWYPNLLHHNQDMGGWSWALGSYWNADITRFIHEPRTKTLGDFMDPYNYQSRLNKPKFWHAASGDQAFLVDDPHEWLADFVANTGETHYMCFPNEEHLIDSNRVTMWGNVESFYMMILDGTPRPEYSYIRDDTSDPGTITFTSVTVPTYVKAWVADTTNRTCEPDDDITGICRRDFRVSRNDVPTDTLITWREEPVEDLGGGVYLASFAHRTDFGYRGFIVEASYPGAGGREFRVTTDINIIPNTFPYTECVSQEECAGVIK